MIKIITGDSAVFTFSIVYPGAVDGLPAPDLSNTTIKFAIEEQDVRVPHTLEKEIVNSDTNIVRFEFSPQETEGLRPGLYIGCCKIYYGENATTVWMGNIIVKKGVLGA